MRNLICSCVLLASACGVPADDLKIPHLIGYAGTPHEVDLGPFVDWDHAYSEELGAYYRIGGAAIVYEMPGCASDPRASTESTPGLVGSTSGTVLRVPRGAVASRVQQRSFRRSTGECVNSEETRDVMPFNDTGAPAPYVPANERTVELR